MSTSNKQVSLRDMTILQKIKRAGMSQLGFSLQVVPDVDRNECDELAIGAPGAAAVLMFKCLQTINVTVSSQIVGSPILREQDMNSTVRVCVHIGYSSKRANVSGYISVQNIVEGGSGASIANPNFKTDLAKRPVQDCKDIYLYFKTAEMAEYTLKTQLELIGIDETLKSEDFVPSVAALSPYSELSKVLKIVRRCSKDDCKPLFSFKLEWSGNPDGTKPYQVGSSKQESLYIIIRNDGHEGYGACVWVSVRGATVSTVVGKEKDGGYECPVISPLIRYGEHSINITLSMMDLSNMDTALGVVAKLRENCNSPNYKQEELNSSYSLDMEKDLVYLDGVTKNFEITDIEISDENIASFKDEHEYTIMNKGSITWKEVLAVITVKKETFIKAVGTAETENCTVTEEAQQYIINCSLTLQAGKPSKVLAEIELLKKEVGAQFSLGRRMNETSKMELYLKPTIGVIEKSLTTVISLKKDKGFGHSMYLIIGVAVILSLLLLPLIAYILYKNNFFQRKEKKKLDVLRDSVRKRSIRLASESRQSQRMSKAACQDQFEMEVVDCVFLDTPISENDDVFKESQAQTHNQPEQMKQS